MLIDFCADRLLSSGIGISFEHGNSKVQWIKDRAVVMSAGDAINSDLILNKQDEFNEIAKHGVKQIAEALYNEIIKLRDQKINLMLSKFGLDQKRFIEKSKQIPENLFLKLVNDIEDVSLDVKFIIAGLNRNGSPHIYVVSDEEGIQCFNSVGFVAIGSGMPLSLLEITKTMHNNFINVSEALVKVYSAKRNAERTIGVGKLTDLGVLHLIGEAPNDFKAGLIEIPQEYHKNIDNELENIEKTDKEVHSKVKVMLERDLFPKEEEIKKLKKGKLEED